MGSLQGRAKGNLFPLSTACSGQLERRCGGSRKRGSPQECREAQPVGTGETQGLGEPLTCLATPKSARGPGGWWTRATNDAQPRPQRRASDTVPSTRTTSHTFLFP